MQRLTDSDGRQKLPSGGVSIETAQGDSDVAASLLFAVCSPFIVQNNTLLASFRLCFIWIQACLYSN